MTLRRLVILAAMLCGGMIFQAGMARGAEPIPVSSGRFISPAGTQTPVGSFPCNGVLSPDGKYLVVTDCGTREYLSVLDTRDGRVTSQIKIGGRRTDKSGNNQGLYYGLAFGPGEREGATLYASRGTEESVAVYHLDGAGMLTETGKRLSAHSAAEYSPTTIAGLALDSRARLLYAVNNSGTSQTTMKGSLLMLETETGRLVKTVELPGFPFAVAALTKGAAADKKVYVSGESYGIISVIDPAAGTVVKTIRVGSHPIALLLDGAQGRLFVANGDSDTISIIDTARDEVVGTIMLRPQDARGLPGVTPTGLALAPGEGRLYASLGDMNAAAVIDLPKNAPPSLAGYIPAGWYPTAVAATADGKRLMIVNGKGANTLNPNSRKAGPQGTWGQYILDIIEGTVSLVTLPKEAKLAEMTHQVVANCRITPDLEQRAHATMKNPGIKHVFYIIKENRTYDQVFGDMTQGDGDPSICLFPREVTPNQHALAERFLLMDNFYVCADVSADGWNWSTSGMISEFAARNVPYRYTGHGREYDYEGRNNLVSVDLFGLPDVATAPCGYLWDLVLRHGKTLRNYAFFSTIIEDPETRPKGRKLMSVDNMPTKKALLDKTDNDYRVFDMTYPDSEARLKYNIKPAPLEIEKYGAHDAPSRYTEWKREFDEYVKNGNLPDMQMIRLPRDHTRLTTPGFSGPRAMVADNDYGVGQIVEAISHSPYWESSAIFILEDDAQNGYDHVDSHRSPALIISPYIAKGTVDHRFHNTDSMLRTMEMLLGLPAMNQYDAAADPIAVFEGLKNADPYTAILPAREIIAQVNSPRAYKAKKSASLDFSKEDKIPDGLANEILWHELKGAKTPAPAVRHGLRLYASTGDGDDD